MYQWRRHRGESELGITADTPEEVFRDALVALAELLGSQTGQAERVATHQVDLAARDRASLLVEWLNELVFLAETEGFVPARATRMALDGTSLTATVEGRRGSPAHLVKAATYHKLEFEPADGGWHAVVVLDV